MRHIDNYILEKLRINKNTGYEDIQEEIKKIIYDYLNNTFKWFKKYEHKLTYEDDLIGGNRLIVNLLFNKDTNFDWYKIRIKNSLLEIFKEKNIDVVNNSNSHEYIQFIFSI